jgi:hypothetical protein
MSRRKPRKPLPVPRPLNFLPEPEGAKPVIVEGTPERLTGQSARAERRISTFVAKNQIAQEQDWGARWINFHAVAQYCAKLRTSRKAAAGKAGLKFAYAQLVEAVRRGEFDVGGRCRVLLLVSHGGKIFSISATELSEAREAFEPDIFIWGYMDKCWTRAGLIGRWFSRRNIPAPWISQTKSTLRIGRGRPLGASDHARDIEVIGRALQLRHERRMSGGKISIREALRIAINKEGSRVNRGGEETDRLRGKLRKRLDFRTKN